MKQACTTVVAAQLDTCVQCGRDLEHGNTYELYLGKSGLCMVCHLAEIIDKDKNESSPPQH